MLNFIPIIGPIITGIVNIWSKLQDKEIVQIQTTGQVVQTETTASAQIIHDTQGDLGLQIIRDAFILFPVVYMNLYVWDKIVALKYPNLVWGVLPLDYLPYLPYMVAVFLLGNIGLNMWKRNG